MQTTCCLPTLPTSSQPEDFPGILSDTRVVQGAVAVPSPTNGVGTNQPHTPTCSSIIAFRPCLISFLGLGSSWAILTSLVSFHP